ncbi:SELENON [Branchiostoma lanceolatum]|uniref:SELENON protein n=1 Tax=Branchiostoma lanceolatum TaxID=7740 RepID=A0A8S4MM34_BRALA|nr:SELENON [Branchiostoma lanceolatum]
MVFFGGFDELVNLGSATTQGPEDKWLRRTDGRRAQGSGRTLREGPLESSPILKMLADHFVSTWTMAIAELESMKSNSPVPEHKKLAKMALDAFVPPVQMMVSLPNGTVVHSLNSHDGLMSSCRSLDKANNVSWLRTDAACLSDVYSKFLKEGMRKAGVEEL